MRGRTLTVALALGMVAGLARADQARPRSGGGGSAGVNHHSSGGHSSGGSAPHASGGNGGHSSPSGGYSTAERRHPRAGTGHGAYYGGHYHPYYPYYGYGYGYWPSYYYGYWPYYGSGAYFGFGYGGGYYGGGYYGGGYYGGGEPYRSYNEGDGGGLRLLVEPTDARVYVDGYYAGEVDDFDGMFQHLNVAPGRHEITLKKEGYRTHRIKIFTADGGTVKIRFSMEKGSGPDTMEDLAGDRGLGEERSHDARGDDRYPGSADQGDRSMSREREDAPVDEPRREPEPPMGLVNDGNAAPGLLSLNVTPADASVYVDGRFVGSARQTGELELRPGRHRVEVVRPGYRTGERDVTIETGRTQALSLDLARP